LIAFDLWIPPPSSGAMFAGVKAVLGLRDDATGMVFVLILSSKADLAEQLEVWYKAEVASNPHVKLVECCCDNGAVNLTERARDWFAGKGVKLVPSPPHMKGRTNLIEAIWRLLLSKVRAMLGDQDVTTFLFPAAMVKACRLLQILSSKAKMGCRSPYVLWHKKIPGGVYLRVWDTGSKCAAKDFAAKNKLSAQGLAGRYLADDESSAWKVLLDKTKRIAKTAHVRFDGRSAEQKALDGETTRMSAVRDTQAGNTLGSDTVARLERTPRGKMPVQEAYDGVDMAPVSQTQGGLSQSQQEHSGGLQDDDLVMGQEQTLRRSTRVRFAPDVFKTEAGGLKSEQDRTWAEQQALRVSSDAVNLQATSLADFYQPCEGITMVDDRFGELGVHQCSDVQCERSAGMFFVDCEFPGAQVEAQKLFTASEELQIAKEDKQKHGRGSEVVVGQEAERIVDFVPKSNREAEKSPAWCASAWRQFAKFDKHGSTKVAKDTGQRRGKTIWVRANKKDAQCNITENYSRLAIRGDLERPGLDYDADSISAHVAEDAHIKILTGAMAVNGWAAFEGDAEGAFHQGKPSRPTFVEMPWFPNVKPKQGYLLEVVTCVYGKVEAAAWFGDRLVEAQAHVGRVPTRSDSAVYVRKTADGSKLLSVCTSHIDDMVQYDTSGDVARAEETMRAV